MPNYSRQWLQGDIVAGITSGVFVIPQSMAYSLLIGIPPKFGLYSALFPAILYSIMGGCGQMAFGPVAILSLLLNTALQTYPDASIEEKVGLCVFLSLMMGITLLLMGVMKFGFITTFLSQPVLSGFTSAAIVIILINQLKLILGVHPPQSPFPLVNLYRQVTTLQEEGFKWATILLALGIIIFNLISKYLIVNIPKTKIPFPGAVISVIFGVLLIIIVPDLADTIEVVGPVPEGIPVPKFPISWFAYERFGFLVNTFLVMALLAFLEMITVGKIYATQNGITLDPNTELVAGGVANIVGSFFQCFPTSGGFGRTPVNASAGARTQLTAMISCVVVAIVILSITSLFSHLPKTVLAGIISVAVISLFDIEQAKYLWQVNKSEFGLMMITFFVTLGIGPQFGIFISVVLSLLLVLFRSSRPGFAILGRLPGTAVYRSIVDYPEAICIPGIILFQFHSPIYFMNAIYLKRKLAYTENILSTHHKTSSIIIDAQAITSVDSVGINVLREIVKTYKEKGIEIFFSALAGRAEKALSRAGLREQIGDDHFFPRLHDAIRFILTNQVIQATQSRAPQTPQPAEKRPFLIDIPSTPIDDDLVQLEDT
uniref:STAS domain-containing protein n=1 Tax=Arcella intermedia TaxID=1963864 RepID=A0A6B2L0D9_9EUKA